MGKLLEMHLLPKLIRLGYSTRSTIEEHTDVFNLFFYILSFNSFKRRYKLFFQVVRNLLAKIVTSFLHVSLATHRRYTLAPCHLSFGSQYSSAIATNSSSFYASIRYTDGVRFDGPRRDAEAKRLYKEIFPFSNALSASNPSPFPR